MNTALRNSITATGKEAQYDACAKRLLGQKYILAHILIKTVEEFHGMHPEDVVPLIEGEPLIRTVPVEPGLTNAVLRKNGTRIVGFNTEASELHEGLIRFDIVFYVRMKNGLSQIIINVEAQRAEPARYAILNRAVFYASRLISSQKERDFENSDYDDIRQVYSIWICMNMDTNSMCHIHLTRDDLIGSFPWRGNLDLLNIILIGLTDELPEHDDTYELHRLLGALLSQNLPVEQKLAIIDREYDIPLEHEFRKEVDTMCSLSQGIKEEGIAIGEARGESRGIAIGESRGETKIILTMYRNGLSAEQISAATDKSIEDITSIIEQKDSAPVS